MPDGRDSDDEPETDPTELRALSAQVREEAGPREWRALRTLSLTGSAAVVVLIAAALDAMRAALGLVVALIAPGWIGPEWRTRMLVHLIAAIGAAVVAIVVTDRVRQALGRRVAPLVKEGRTEERIVGALPPWPQLARWWPDREARAARRQVDPGNDDAVSPELRQRIHVWRRRASMLQTITIFPLAVTVFLGSVRWPAIAMWFTGHGNPGALDEGDVMTWTQGDDPLLTLFLIALFGVLLPCALVLLATHRQVRRLVAEAERERAPWGESGENKDVPR